jgi:uncharacterized protein YkwD
MRFSLVFWLIITGLPGFSQIKWDKDFYLQVNLNNFRENKLFLEAIDFNNIDYPRLHAAIFYVTNEQRAKVELPFLNYAPELEIAAYNHSKNMVEDGFFSHSDHINPERETPNDRGLLAGISNPFVAENIAESFGLEYKANSTIYILDLKKPIFSYKPNGKPILPHTYLSFAEQVVYDWMHSEGHRKNIFSNDAISLGCGAYFYPDKNFYNMPKFKVTQNFQLFEVIKSITPADKLP